MSKDVVMPALGMAQETGTLLRWLKQPGDSVTKGEMLMEVETDKALVEIEAPASGILADVTAQPGDVVPVGQVIARILTPNEQPSALAAISPTSTSAPSSSHAPTSSTPRISPLAARIAADHGVDVNQIKTARGIIQKGDVLAYIEAQKPQTKPTRILASPKARRLAQERGISLDTLHGSGPDGAILTTDVLAVQMAAPPRPPLTHLERSTAESKDKPDTEALAVSGIWRVMVERLSQAWTTIPHFYLAREVNASRLVAWREVKQQTIEKITYTDLLVKLVTAALQQHPRLNGSWQNNALVLNHRYNIGLAVAVDAGLVVPVIHDADQKNLADLTAQRIALIERAHAGKLSPNDINGGTFTISNLGMYGVDAFNAIVNPPQAAILAISRIAERVIPVNHQPSVQPMMTLTLSCDHRAVDGARAAHFLDTLAQLIEEPLALLD